MSCPLQGYGSYARDKRNLCYILFKFLLFFVYFVIVSCVILQVAKSNLVKFLALKFKVYDNEYATDIVSLRLCLWFRSVYKGAKISSSLELLKVVKKVPYVIMLAKRVIIGITRDLLPAYSPM